MADGQELASVQSTEPATKQDPDVQHKTPVVEEQPVAVAHPNVVGEEKPVAVAQPQVVAEDEPVTMAQSKEAPVSAPPPVVGQPQGPGGQWMPAPEGHENCPPGLEYLTMIDQVLVQQQVELLEAFTGFETNNKYELKNSMGQRIYFAAEETDCCARVCCGTHRAFKMRIIDNYGKEVLHLLRSLRCATCWCPCCLQKVEVQAPPGKTIGYVRQGWSLCSPKYYIQDAEGETVLRVEGPCVTCTLCMGDIIFDVKSANGDVPLGEIRKQWSGFAKEIFTDADNFGVSFPMDLDVHVKATLLAAVFLIDFMFFEQGTDDDKKEKTAGAL